MPERMGGFERHEFDDASRALARVQDLDALLILVEERSVYRSPLFHAYLRQQRLQFEGQAHRSPEAYAAFLQVYDALFTLLHYRAHASEPPVPTPGASGSLVGPELLLRLLSLSQDALPAVEGPTFDAGRDGPAIAAELQGRLGQPCQLPQHASLPGALFALLRLRCARCGEDRLALRAFAMDLRLYPQWLKHLQHGDVNADTCAQCGTAKSHVVRCWVTEQPAPADPLAALSCLCRRSDYEAIYLPPPGTARRAENDRVLEIRLEMLARQLGPPWAHVTTPNVVHTDGIAYSVDELSWRIERTQQDGTASTEYADVCQTMVEKLGAGEVPYRDAEKFLRGIVGPTVVHWPLEVAEGGAPVEALVYRLVFEICTEARGLPPAARAAAACSVAQAYARLGEVGLAEMSLARARDLAAQVGPDEARTLQLGLLSSEESLHIARGEQAEAEHVRAQLQTGLMQELESPTVRLAQAELAMNQALADQTEGRLADALRALQGGVEEFLELEREHAAGNPAMAARARQGRSGSLANLSGVRVQIAEGLELLATLLACKGRFEQLTDDTRAALSRLGSAERLVALQRELLEQVPTVLSEAEREPQTLRQRALRELRDAIALAESVSDFEYLGIQQLKLAWMLDTLGSPREAREARAQAARHAARAGDQARLAAVAWAQARDAAADGDAKARLDALERCLRAEMRRLVKGGGGSGALSHLGAFALQAAERGEVGVRAILIAEGTKRLALAQSIARGSLLAASASLQESASRLDALLAKREALRLETLWQTKPATELVAQLAASDSAIASARTELAQRDPRYAAWHDATYLELVDAGLLRRLLEALGARTTLLGFLIDGAVGYAYALWQQGCLIRSLPLSGTLRGELGRGDTAASQAELASWTAALLAELDGRLEALQPDDRLVLSPCRELEQIAFATLASGDGVLCQRATLSVVHGSGMFEACAQRPQLAWHRAACLGAPTRPNLEPLAHVRVEVERVTELLAQAGVEVAGPLVGTRATVPELRRLAPESDLVHLACHAEPPSAAQPSGRLLLAPSPLKGDSGELTDERIVAELAVKPGALVVLAACASGVFGASRRFLDHGLVPAWLVAGAGQVLSSLVPIDDAAALDFHTAFYRYLAAGCRPAAALARTQRQALRGELGPRLQSPDHWGAYVLFGIG